MSRRSWRHTVLKRVQRPNAFHCVITPILDKTVGKPQQTNLFLSSSKIWYCIYAYRNYAFIKSLNKELNKLKLHMPLIALLLLYPVTYSQLSTTKTTMLTHTPMYTGYDCWPCYLLAFCFAVISDTTAIVLAGVIVIAWNNWKHIWQSLVRKIYLIQLMNKFIMDVHRWSKYFFNI